MIDLRPRYERPLAAAGLTSYRFRGTFGWVMIGAKDVPDAMRQAARSTNAPMELERLEVWEPRLDAYREIRGVSRRANVD
jgi:hypothetical protein